MVAQDVLKRAMKAGGAILEAARPPYKPCVLKRVDFAVVPPGKGANTADSAEMRPTEANFE